MEANTRPWPAFCTATKHRSRQQHPGSDAGRSTKLNRVNHLQTTRSQACVRLEQLMRSQAGSAACVFVSECWTVHPLNGVSWRVSASACVRVWVSVERGRALLHQRQALKKLRRARVQTVVSLLSSRARGIETLRSVLGARVYQSSHLVEEHVEVAMAKRTGAPAACPWPCMRVSDTLSTCERVSLRRPSWFKASNEAHPLLCVFGMRPGDVSHCSTHDQFAHELLTTDQPEATLRLSLAASSHLDLLSFASTLPRTF